MNALIIKSSIMKNKLFVDFSFHILLHTFLVDIAHPASDIKKYALKNIYKDMIRVYNKYIESFKIPLEDNNHLPICKNDDSMF